MEPAVSIIIPTYNRSRFIVNCVGSCLKAGSGESCPEIIVVDDGSTDDTLHAVAVFGARIKYVRLPKNCGRNHARNRGLELSSGRYVKFLDSDDLLYSGSLDTEFDLAIDSDSDIVVSGWAEAVIGEDDKEQSRMEFQPPLFKCIIDDILAGKAVPTSAALYRRELLREVRWDTSLREFDDWDFFVSAALRARKIVSGKHISYTWQQHRLQGIRFYTMIGTSISHHRVLKKIEDELRDRNELQEGRKKRLAQYYYKELRVIAMENKNGFETALRHIFTLDPVFLPSDEERQWWMKVACRLFGVRTTILVHCWLKKLYVRSRSPHRQTGLRQS